MEAENHIINLIDDFWFTKQLFKKPFSSIPDHKNLQEYSPEPSDKPSSSNQKTIFSDHQIIQDSSEFSSQIMSMKTRSKSEENMSMISSCPLSPNSVLHDQPHLDTILSGKEGISKAKRGEKNKKKKVKKEKIGLSKSLSELEFEELKGFMDLGFEFSEEDTSDSALVSILPGLQRLGKKGNNGEELMQSEYRKDPATKRPYLSEAWNRPLISWRVPSESNEIGMKDSLKLWAHTVASSVR